MHWRLATTILLLLAGASASFAQDTARGEKAFKKCTACHAVGEGAKNKVGPHLNGIFGRKAGQTDGFKYSKAMLESGIVWDEARLADYLRNPRGVVKGTSMAFVGLKRDEEVADVIAFLKSYGADGTKQ